MWEDGDEGSRRGSALIMALALLIVVTIVCLGLVLQFARWRRDYQYEREKTEQIMIQFEKGRNRLDSGQKARDSANSSRVNFKIEL